MGPFSDLLTYLRNITSPLVCRRSEDRWFHLAAWSESLFLSVSCGTQGNQWENEGNGNYRSTGKIFLVYATKKDVLLKVSYRRRCSQHSRIYDSPTHYSGEQALTLLIGYSLWNCCKVLFFATDGIPGMWQNYSILFGHQSNFRRVKWNDLEQMRYFPPLHQVQTF